MKAAVAARLLLIAQKVYLGFYQHIHTYKYLFKHEIKAFYENIN